MYIDSNPEHSTLFCWSDHYSHGYFYSLQILYDFDLMYKNANSTAFFSDIWTNLRVRLYELNEQGVDGSDYPINDDNFLDFLYLLNALPSPRNKFAASVRHFIKISEVIILFEL